jgi:ribosomal-protein-alanine N-acetyltransferase
MLRTHPRLETERLKLRPFLPEDAVSFSQLAGSREVADTMIALPHPLSESAARTTIAANAAEFQRSRALHFAMELKSEGALVGGIDVRDIDREHRQAELTFWIAPEHWGEGLAAEAGAAVLAWTFRELELNRIFSCYMLRNPTSGSVLQKLGMKLEGTMRERVFKWGSFEDVALCSLLRSDFAGL